MFAKGKFSLEQSSKGACVLRMPGVKPKPGFAKDTKTLPQEFSTEKYMINFDYDAGGNLLGIEVVSFD